jgi:hypothetical protein
MKLFVSPLAFLEYTGITVQAPNTPDDLIKNAKPSYSSMMKLAEETYNYARSFFENNANITNERVKEELEKRKRYVCHEGLKYWEIAINRYSKPESLWIIHHCLAAEFVQKIQMKKVKASYYHPSLWMNAAKRMNENVDVCLFRTIQWRWNVDSRSEQLKILGKDIFNRFCKAMGVRMNDDYLDAELIHYSCFGKMENGKLQAVDAFTCDPIRKIKDRTIVFTEGLKKTINELNTAVDNSGKKWIHKFPNEAPGTVTIFSFSGDLIEGPLLTNQIANEI